MRTNHQAACTGKAVAADGDAAGFIARINRNIIGTKLSLAKRPALFRVAKHIFNTCILTKRDAATLIDIRIDMRILADSYIAAIGIRLAITGTNPRASTDSNTIRTPCISSITNSNGTHLICICPNTGSQSISSGGTFIVIVLRFFIRRVDAIEMRLRCSKICIYRTANSVQLSHVDGIRILLTSSDVSNLTGNVLRSITDGDSSRCRFPDTARIFTMVAFRWIIAKNARIERGYGAGTNSYTAFDIGQRVMANGYGIGCRMLCIFYICAFTIIFIAIRYNSPFTDGDTIFSTTDSTVTNGCRMIFPCIGF